VNFPVGADEKAKKHLSWDNLYSGRDSDYFPNVGIKQPPLFVMYAVIIIIAKQHIILNDLKLNQWAASPKYIPFSY
jgi:hypothetical protein